MDALDAIRLITGASPQPHAETARPSPVSLSNSVATDAVEFTADGLNLARRHQLNDVRAELIDRVRASIAAGTYQTDEKISVTVDRVFGELMRLDLRA